MTTAQIISVDFPINLLERIICNGLQKRIYEKIKSHFFNSYAFYVVSSGMRSDILGNDRTWDLAIVVTPEDLVDHPGVAFVAASYSCSVEQMNPTKIGAGHRHGAFLSAITISLGGGKR